MNFIKNNLEHFVNFIKFVNERLLCIIVTLLFIILITFCFFEFAEIKNPESMDSQQIYICGISLENFGIWFTFIGLIITAFWSMHQYNKNKRIKQQERASEIAQDYSDNIIEKLAIISDILLSNPEIKIMFSKIVKSEKLNQFTKWETIDILEDKQCFNKYEKIIHSSKTQTKYETLLNKRYNEYERNKFNSCFPLLVENTLNHLEAICINISSKAAGSQFIYDSLHQSFLKTVEILAVKISSNNDNNVDKYYINIIQVYNMWIQQREKDIKKFNRTQKKIYKTQNKINNLTYKAEKDIKKLLSKENKTV